MVRKYFLQQLGLLIMVSVIMVLTNILGYKMPVTGKRLCDRCYIPGCIYGSYHCIRRICRDLTWKRPEGFC